VLGGIATVSPPRTLRGDHQEPGQSHDDRRASARDTARVALYEVERVQVAAAGGGVRIGSDGANT